MHLKGECKEIVSLVLVKVLSRTRLGSWLYDDGGGSRVANGMCRQFACPPANVECALLQLWQGCLQPFPTLAAVLLSQAQGT